MRDFLSVLNSEQYDAVTHEGSPLLILAGAGSGKTRVITTKIAYLIKEKNVDPYSILAVTFTKKAANEMYERAIQIEEKAKYSQIKTFHSFGAWFLRMYGDVIDIPSNFTVYDDDDMVTLITKSTVGLTRQQASHYAHKISLAKDYCYGPEDLMLDEIDSDQNFRLIYRAYEKRLRSTGNVDFGDLIMLPVKILTENNLIRQRLLQRFRVIMVDEYQDSNVAQFKLLESLSGYGSNFSENPAYVCVVGDDDQSIYKFRGAEVKNILNFKSIFPNTKIIRLEKNYRSKSEILAVADDIVKNNNDRLGKKLSAERGNGKLPVLAFLPNQDEEAKFCADLIEQTHEMGIPYNEWAILYRTNAQSLSFESEFLKRRIPYTVVGSLKFYEREEIKDLLAFLALIVNSKDEIAFRRIINKPTRGIGATTQEKIINSARNEGIYDFVKYAKEHCESFSKKTSESIKSFVLMMENFYKTITEELKPLETPKKLSVLIDEICENSGLKEYHAADDEISGTQRVLNMQELSNSASLYDCTTEGLLAFLDHIELDRTLEKPEEDNIDKVTLITLHNTKGLEFKRVVITGMELGIFPRQDKTGEDLEEERRLCYVGVTRAQNELYMTSCASRRMYGRTEFVLPSTFLKEINKDNLRILGHIPSSFKSNTEFHGGDYGKNGLSHPTFDDPIKEKYKVGTNVFHDEYGSGVVVNSVYSEENEVVITIQFENNSRKKFLPKYQENSLLVIKE